MPRASHKPMKARKYRGNLASAAATRPCGDKVHASGHRYRSYWTSVGTQERLILQNHQLLLLILSLADKRSEFGTKPGRNIAKRSTNRVQQNLVNYGSDLRMLWHW